MNSGAVYFNKRINRMVTVTGEMLKQAEKPQKELYEQAGIAS